MNKSTRHILIVDDEPHLCRALRRILEGEGYRVTTASDGHSALQAAAADQPDLVLLDLMMPGMDGQEVCHRLREAGNPARVIYFTARGQPASPARARQLMEEADGIITKPATSRRILARIRSVLEDQAGHRGLEK